MMDYGMSGGMWSMGWFGLVLLLLIALAIAALVKYLRK